MATTKKSKAKSKSVAKTTTSRTKGGAVAVAAKRPSEGLLFFAAICITFLLVVDTYYIYQLAQVHN
jgi:hypothetical protein